jgi:hypothetical protein
MSIVMAGVVCMMILALAVLVGVALESVVGRRLVTNMRSFDDRGPGLTT